MKDSDKNSCLNSELVPIRTEEKRVAFRIHFGLEPKTKKDLKIELSVGGISSC